ncbi:MAG TPA: glutathione S-transferase [Castellaniella sp.]|uniref:glutathione S-transferase n=1 Tax=Castellaniella sp. TaxID=1955812 RepID=UPI002EE278EF
MKLFGSVTSPYARKCLVVAHELGLFDQLQVKMLSTGPTTHNAELMQVNPLCKLPTLMTDDGMVLYDSRVISDYLNEKAGGSLVPKDASRWQVRVTQSLADGVLDAALLMRYEVALRPAEFRWDAWSQGQQEKVLSALDQVERTAAQCLAGVDLGTIGLACALSYLDLRFADLGWRRTRPALDAWMASFSQRASMQATAFKS